METRDRDLEHLKLLSIFHYIMGGLVALGSCILLIHFTLGVLLATGAIEANDPNAKAVGILLILVALTFIALGWTYAILLILAGRKLGRHTSRTFCFVVAGISCICIPWGTILGVFTMVVLVRDSVAALFAETDAAA